jgi:tRNA-specific 2-thiouridylase
MKTNPNTNKKVFIGLSGGVDSSVSALLLKKEGYDVTGVFIRVWHPDFIPCNWRAEMHDAMRICAKLDIPFMVCNLEKEYKEGVIDYMVSEYKIGRTPNPDVMCNKEIKFNAFLKFAMENGADYIATGHYAQNIDNKLANSVDTEKDQTYFLWNIKKNDLPKIKFPIGHLEKSEVRKIAQKNNLDTATKKDSQGLCFIGHVDMKDFLRRYINTKNGAVLDESGVVIGTHNGSELYTIGERHGFEINKHSTNDKPLYVISKDLEKNTITVSENKINQSNQEIILEKYNLLTDDILLNKQVLCRVRYRQDLQKCTITDQRKDFIKIKFEKEQESITKGQSAVLYLKDYCLGGGIIK